PSARSSQRTGWQTGCWASAPCPTQSSTMGRNRQCGSSTGSTVRASPAWRAHRSPGRRPLPRAWSRPRSRAASREPAVDAREVLEQHLPTLERSLQAALASDGTPLTAAARYVLGWEDAEGRASTPGGKRLRPLLTLHVASLFRADPAVAMPGAVAIEL